MLFHGGEFCRVNDFLARGKVRQKHKAVALADVLRG